MKLTTTTSVPVEKPADFARQMSNNALAVSVTAVITSNDLTQLIRALNAKPRPFAVAVLEGK